MKRQTRRVILAAGLMAAGFSAIAQTPPAHQQGGMLVGGNGMTLYTFDNDAAGSGKSACNGKCAENWPPLTAGGGDKATGDYSVVARDDGRMQWAYKGKPLYFWSRDQKPGDKTGDGFNNVWHVAR
jgi:predicted lipoprotein with Yx(FWY)xxD motif